MKSFLQRLSLLIVVAILSSVGAMSQVEISGTPYTTLKAAFDAINSGTHTGNIQIAITGNTSETATAVLNASGVGSASYSSVVIFPTTNAVISGSIAKALVELKDADYVTIDGRINQTGTSYSLTFQNNATTDASVIRIDSAAGGNGPRNNTVQYLNIIGGSASTSSVYGVLVGAEGSSLTTGAHGIKNISILNNKIYKTYNGVRLGGLATNGLATDIVVDGNNFGDNGTAGNGVAISIYLTYVNTPIVQNNYIKAILTTLFTGINILNSTSILIHNNTIQDLTTNSSSTSYGIKAESPGVVSNNKIYNLLTGYHCHGINVASSTPVTVKNNKIEKIRSFSTGGYGAYGVSLTSGSNHIVSNNVISDLTSINYSASSTSDNPFGIRITSGTGHKIYFNTVKLFGVQYGGGSNGTLSAALITTGSSYNTLDIRNNIFINTLEGLTGSKSYAIYLYGTGNLTGTTIDNNDYYVGGLYGVLAYVGSDKTTLADLKTATSQDLNSVSVDPVFNSNSVLIPFTGSPVAGIGVSIIGYETDFNGATRSATPTLGAYEQVGDFAAPTFAFAPLANTYELVDRELNATITDLSGVNSTSMMPRIYYRKTTNANAFVDNTSSTDGWKYTEATGTAPNFIFSISNSLLFGGLIPGDQIEYFIVAQDISTLENVAASSGTFAIAPTSVALTSGQFPITGVSNNYLISYTYAGTIEVGEGKTYTSLTGADGLFAALNNGFLSGSVNIEITSDLTETGAVALNQIPEIGVGNYSISIMPSTNARTVSFNKAGSCLWLNQVDRVTIDGRIAGVGNNLTFVNASTSDANVIDITGSSTNGATDITIRNVNIIGGNSTSSSYHGIILRDISGSTAVTTNSNNVSLIENSIKKVYYGIRALGSGITGLMINKNEIGDADVASTVTFRAIQVTGAIAPLVKSNNIFNISTSSSVNNAAIELASGTINNAEITENNITGVYSFSTGGYGASGIIVASTSDNVLIANNMISDVVAVGDGITSTSYSAFGIKLAAGTNIKLYNNTINMAGTLSVVNTKTCMNTAVAVTATTVTGVELQNNILINRTTNYTSTSKSYVLWMPASYTGATIVNNNHYFVGGNYPYFAYAGADILTFEDWKTASSKDANSTYDSLAFVSDLYPCIDGEALFNTNLIKPLTAGMPTTDIHGEARNVSNNFAGADIAVASSVSITTDLPAHVKKGSNATYDMTFTPQVNAFADGIVRTAPAGHVSGMTYQWFQNGTPIVSGQNDVVVNNNTISFNLIKPSNSGNYYSIVTAGASSAQTSTCSLEVETLEPTLNSPANNSIDQPLNTVVSWIPALDATDYMLQFSTDPTFTTNVIEVSTTGTTYTPTNLDFYTDYYWRVRGYNSQNTSIYTSAWTFKTRPAIHPITVITPNNNAVNLNPVLTFGWNLNSDATGYQIQIATDENFTSLYIDTIVSGNVYNSFLQFSNSYHWRVRGVNATHEGFWSTVRTFTTRPAIYPVVLVAPANNAAGIVVSPTFSWQSNVDATSYLLEIYADEYLMDKVDAVTTTSTSYVYQGLNFGQTYYWRVKGINSQYQSEWSVLRNFTTSLFALDNVTIGTGTSIQTAPLNRYYNHNVSESIYLQSEVGNAKTIGSIAYYKASGANTALIDSVFIYMKHTTDTELTSDSLRYTDYTLVYNGQFVNNAASGWMQVNLQNPFYYDGANNLQVLVVKKHQQYIFSGYPQWRYTSKTPTRHRSAEEDDYLPEELSANSNLPNVRFGYVEDPLTMPTLTSPTDLAVDVYMNHNFTWTAVPGATSYRVQASTSPLFDTFVENKVVTTNSAQLNLEFNTTHYWRVRATSANNVSDWSEVYSFTTTPYILYGTYNIGSGSGNDFPNLSAFFHEINVEGALVASDINLVVTSDITEPATASLNEFGEYFGTGHTITIKPDGNTLRTISANAPNSAVVKLMGADRIIFDGQANESSAKHKLHIVNLAGEESVALWLASTNTEFAGCENITVKNMILSTMTTDINLYSSAGIFSGGANAIGATPIASNNNVVITNNIFHRAKRGVLFQGHTVNRPTGVVISNNTFGAEEFANLLFNGFELFNLQAPVVTLNTIINTQNNGISISTTNNSNINNNEIYTTNPNMYPGTVYGINIQNSANSVIDNNIIKHFRTYGVFSQSNPNLQVTNNVISNTGLLNNNIATVTGVYVATSANQAVTVKANKIYDLNSTYFVAAANGSAYGISVYGSTVSSSATPITIENNMIWNISGYGSANPTYVQNNPYGILIGTGRNVNIYNNTVLMNGSLHSGTGYSACLFMTNTGINNIDVRNNMFVNKINANSAQNYIYYVTSPATFNTFDNNIYSLAGASNGKIGYLTANTASYTSLSQWQSALTKDAASKVKTVPFEQNLPYLTFAANSDPEFRSPSVITVTDINGTARNASNNTIGAYIPLFNDAQARYLIFNGITTNSMNMSWINGNGQGRLVLVSTDNLTPNDWYEMVTNLNTNINTYSEVNGSWNNKVPVMFGTKTGYVINKVSGASRTAVISGLTPSTTYYYHVVEYTSAGSVTRYNPFPHTLNPRSVETLFETTAPTVLPATNVAYDMFTANWNYNVDQRIDGFEMMLDGIIYDVAASANPTVANAYMLDLFATANTAYSYKVRAKKAAMTTDWSALQNVNTYPMTVINGPVTACATNATEFSTTLGNVQLGNIVWSSNAQATITPNANGASVVWNNDGNVMLYASITDANGNIGTVSKSLFVNALPLLLVPENFEVCLTAPAFQLHGAPLGGTFSGVGVSNGMFDPTVAGLGNKTITYTYTDPTTNCTNTATFVINVKNAITVTAPENMMVCVDLTPFELTGGMPDGGTYSGNGVDENTFYPALAGVGIHTITYTFNDQYGCSNFATFTIDVKALPVLTVPDNFAACIDDAPITLSAAPTGGTFSGTGVTGNSFDPSVATVGDHTITYTYTDGNGCENTESFVITVDPLPVVTVENVAICVDAAPLTLTASPTGGTFAGPGIANGVFTPTTVGTFNATYSYTAGACTVVEEFTITVNALPVVTAPANLEVCLNDAEITLTGATPEGGVYSGNGVSGGMFNPSVAGVGSHTITYTYADANGCDDAKTFVITVKPLPEITVPANFSICVDASPVNLVGSLPAGGTYSGAGVSGGMFNPSVAGVGTHTITYTYTAANGCTNSNTFTATVNALPVITVPNNMTVCIDTTPFELTGALPIDGEYSGNGVVDGMFNPALAGSGSHTITYTFTDANGCTNSDDFVINVTAAPLFTTQPQNAILAETTSITFTSATAVVTDTYQWQVKVGTAAWTDIPNETNATLALTNVDYSLNGNMYRVVATGCTQTISNEVTLTVVNRPTQATNINWLNWGRSQITMNWTNGGGNGRLVVATKAAAWPANGWTPTDNVFYTSNVSSDFGNPMNVITHNAVDYYIVYNGTANGPLSVTNLERLTAYSFHVFEYKTSGSVILYNVNTDVNNPLSRSTSRKDGNFDNDGSESAYNSFNVGAITPNPASERVSFNIDVVAQGEYRVELVNMLGEVVYTNSAFLAKGNHPFEIRLNSERGNMPSGTYILRVSSNDEMQTRNVVVVK